jgi:toxin ParE1/3/4
MKAFEVTKEAKDDLKIIARFTEKRWERNQRFLYIKQFDDVFHLLAEAPAPGKRYDFIKKGYRKFPQGIHVLFYREASKSTIIIIRILHKNMDVEAKFLHT